MYHRVPQEDDCTGHPYYCTSTAVEVFAKHIAFLHSNGYSTIRVGETLDCLEHGASGRKLVSLTFDDGYRDFYTHAFPILSAYGYSATVFLPTAFIGDERRRFKDEDCLIWSEVRELSRAGVAFGAHTVTHPQLRDLSACQVREELQLSKSQIEAKLGQAVEVFSYPYAFPEADRKFVARLGDVLTECGYRTGVSTSIGLATSTDNMLFRRLPVNSHDDTRFFRAKLLGAYDWLHPVQCASKQIRIRRNPQNGSSS